MIKKVYTSYQQEVAVIAEKQAEDPDEEVEDLVAAQETAAFNEPKEKIALGGLFNVFFGFSILDAGRQVAEPQGALLEAINKRFTDFNGFKEAFRKTVENSFLPGWVWLAVSKDGSQL